MASSRGTSERLDPVIARTERKNNRLRRIPHKSFNPGDLYPGQRWFDELPLFWQRAGLGQLDNREFNELRSKGPLNILPADLVDGRVVPCACLSAILAENAEVPRPMENKSDERTTKVLSVLTPYPRRPAKDRPLNSERTCHYRMSGRKSTPALSTLAKTRLPSPTPDLPATPTKRGCDYQREPERQDAATIWLPNLQKNWTPRN